MAHRNKTNNFWAFVHNAIAHPLLVTQARWADRFHDWTGTKAWGWRPS